MWESRIYKKRIREMYMQVDGGLNRICDLYSSVRDNKLNRWKRQPDVFIRFIRIYPSEYYLVRLLMFEKGEFIYVFTARYDSNRSGYIGCGNLEVVNYFDGKRRIMSGAIIINKNTLEVIENQNVPQGEYIGRMIFPGWFYTSQRQSDNSVKVMISNDLENWVASPKYDNLILKTDDTAYGVYIRDTDNSAIFQGQLYSIPSYNNDLIVTANGVPDISDVESRNYVKAVKLGTTEIEGWNHNLIACNGKLFDGVGSDICIINPDTGVFEKIFTLPICEDNQEPYRFGTLKISYNTHKGKYFFGIDAYAKSWQGECTLSSYNLKTFVFEDPIRYSDDDFCYKASNSGSDFEIFGALGALSIRIYDYKTTRTSITGCLMFEKY